MDKDADLKLNRSKTRFESCPTCEQPVPAEETSNQCPHCKQPLQVGLELDSGVDFEEHRKELAKKFKKNPEDTNIQNELAFLLYAQGMKLRYDAPQNALSFFEEVVKIAPKHYEARLKVSWLAIRFSKYKEAREVLQELLESDNATTLQRQRGYTNLSCAWNWDPEEPSPVKAEKAARDGIALDEEGTAKLWENLATALRNQQLLEEARIAFRKALTLNPKSLNAIERQASIERHLKIQKKKARGANKPLFKLKIGVGHGGGGGKSPREKKSKDYEKL